MSVDHLINLLTDVGKTDLSQNLLSFFIAWRIVRKTIKAHMTAVETSLKNVADNVSRLESALLNIETNHANRISALEITTKTLTDEVIILRKG